MRVVCVGSASKDIFFPTGEGEVRIENGVKKLVFNLGAKYHINDRFESLGGCAVNQAVGMSRLGIQVSCYSSVGDDLIGRWIIDEMEKERVDMNLIQIENNCPSGLSDIVVEEGSGERIIFSNQEANEKLEVNPEKLGGADLVSVTDLSGDWRGVLGSVLEYCKEKGIKTAINPRRINIKEDPKSVLRFSRMADVFFSNKDEAMELLGKVGVGISNDEKEAFLVEKIQELGPNIAVVTDGERGAWITDGEKTFQALAAKEKAVDSTGAGDAFSSGFLAAFIQGKEIEECAKWGILNGGSVVNFYGGTEGLLGVGKIEERLNKVQITKL